VFISLIIIKNEIERENDITLNFYERENREKKQGAYQVIAWYAGVASPSVLKRTTSGYFIFITLTLGKVCDNPILQESNGIFSGSGSTRNYESARFSTYHGTGWCGSGSTPYILLDLQKEYHITRVVTMGNREQTKWSEAYSMKYSHNKTLVDDSKPIKVFTIISFKDLEKEFES
jgi:hypothetical protein